MARCVAAGAVGVLVAGTAGTAAADDNGIADQSAQTIAAKSRAAMQAATSMRMVAELTDRTGTTGLDIAFDTQGNCTGTVKLPGDNGKADVVKRGQDVWMKLDEALLRSQIPGPAADDAIALINGRWLHGTTNSVLLKDFSLFCDLNHFKEKFTAKPAGEQLTKGAETKVDGAPAIAVNSRHAGETGTFYVSTQDEPYLLRIDGKDAKGNREKATFSDFNKPVPTKTPAPSDSVDLSQLR